MRLFAFMLLSFSLFANNISLEEIDSKPPSLAKNFMIWQYLHQDISSEEADEAFYQFRDVNVRTFNAYAKKSDREEVVYTSECLTMKLSDLKSSNDVSCIKIRFSPYRATLMSQKERHRMATLLKNKTIDSWMPLMDDLLQTQHKTDLSNYKPSTFMYLFLTAGSKFRQQHLNRPLPKSYLKAMTKHWGFKRFVVLVVTDARYGKLQKELLALDPSLSTHSETHFYLALNAIEHQDNKMALAHLKKAHKKAYFRSHKDKMVFWQYLITKDQKLLKQLSESIDINNYSLYAKEKLGVKVENYYTVLPTDTNATVRDLSDPFVWNEILNEVKATPKTELATLEKKYARVEMLPVQSFIHEKVTGYKESGYIMPYDQYMSDLSKDDKALYYALMRQESRFVPSALSRSYALGLMQMMPFLVRALDKSFKEPRERYDEMFQADKNIAYAKKHISWLQKSLYHPLLIAYAYNGGIGFTKRYITKENCFTDAKYEPFMSMEMMVNSESREYGKKVLTNYVMYKKILGEEASIVQLYDSLSQPLSCDSFRAPKSASR